MESRLHAVREKPSSDNSTTVGSSLSGSGPSGSLVSGSYSSVEKRNSKDSKEISGYAFFAKYTYTTECALLAYNFHRIVQRDLRIFDRFDSMQANGDNANGNNVDEKKSKVADPKLVSVTLAFLFYKFQVHHCDMALDLALTLTYLEDLSQDAKTLFGEGDEKGLFATTDAFNVVTYLCFLAHAFNADRTIRLRDWHAEVGWRHHASLKALNAYVFFLFSKVRKLRLQVSESRVKKYIQKLCAVPQQTQGLE